jgi:hypothetical protein
VNLALVNVEGGVGKTMRFPFDLFDHPLATDSDGSLEPVQETVMVCTACHSSDAMEDGSPKN